MLTKNKLKDQRIWILGAGESLNKHNLDLLRNENVILTNRTIELMVLQHKQFDNFTWCWNDFNYLPDITKLPLGRAVFDNTVVGTEINMRKPWINHWMDHKDLMKQFKHFVPFDCERMVSDGNFSYNVGDRTYCGWTVVIDLAIPLAMWWGCKDIYLIGCDTSHTPHFNGAYHYANPSQIKLTQVGYQRVRDVATKEGFNIYNAGVGGELEVFPRVNYEEVLND